MKTRLGRGIRGVQATNVVDLLGGKGLPKAPSLGEELLSRDLKTEGFQHFIREHKFHPMRNWRLDFAWPFQKIGVEVEGGVWSGGRHNRGQGFIDDCEKYNTAAAMGWKIFRFPTEQVEDGTAVKFLKEKVTWFGFRRGKVGR